MHRNLIGSNLCQNATKYRVSWNFIDYLSYICCKSFVTQINRPISRSSQIILRTSNMRKIEVCTGPYPTREPGWVSRWEGIFPTGRADKWGMIFPTSLARLAHEGWFIQRTGPGRASTWEVIFLTGQAGPTKREMSFLTAEFGYKKRKTNNITSQSGLIKQRGSFETDR